MTVVELLPWFIYSCFRPVTLVGFSLGARVILKCLQCLAETKGDNGEITNHHLFLSFLLVGRVDRLISFLFNHISTGGLVERVVLLGAAVSINDEEWEDARKVFLISFIH